MIDHSCDAARLRVRVMRAHRDYEMRRVCDENVLLHVDGGNYMLARLFVLNDTAAYIWHKACQCDFTEGDIVRWLTDRYDVAECEAEASARLMADRLLDYGLARCV